MRERGAARKAKVHVEAQDVRVVGKHLQAAEQAKIGLAPTRLRQRLQEFQRLQRIGR
jgi:hypothetical protein